VSIKGDLGEIDIGSGSVDTPALRSLSATSLGLDGLNIPFAPSPLQSAINGSLKKLTLLGDMRETELSVTGDIASITIGGDLIESAIRSDSRIGSIRLGGNVSGTTQKSATISAAGVPAPLSDAKAVAIGSIAIGGSVDHAQILAGYDHLGTAINPDASIGAVRVIRDWTASTMAAGAAAGIDGLFGTDDDQAIQGGGSLVAKIASVVIKGEVSGTAAEGDHFGFVAQEIGSFQVSGAKLGLTEGAANDLVAFGVGTTGDTIVREIA